MNKYPSIECSKCKKNILSGDPYTMTVITEEIFCPDCDEGLLKEGDIFLSVD